MKHITIRSNGTDPLIVWQDVYSQTEIVKRKNSEILYSAS